MTPSDTRKRQEDRAAGELIDTELAHLPAEARWREWMNRIEAVIFAAAAPVPREMLVRIVGRDCNLDLIIDDIRADLQGRPYELVKIAGGWPHRIRKDYAYIIRASFGISTTNDLSPTESLALTAIAYFQPITRAELSKIFSKEISRDVIGYLRAQNLIIAGPRSPQPGAPYTYVTTKAFLSHFGFDTLRDLPDIEALEDAGLLNKEKLLAGDWPDPGKEENGPDGNEPE